MNQIKNLLLEYIWHVFCGFLIIIFSQKFKIKSSGKILYINLMFFHRSIYFESIKSRLKLKKLFNSSVIEVSYISCIPILYIVLFERQNVIKVYYFVYIQKDRMKKKTDTKRP